MDNNFTGNQQSVSVANYLLDDELHGKSVQRLVLAAVGLALHAVDNSLVRLCSQQQRLH